jgi:hypothetical protein
MSYQNGYNGMPMQGGGGGYGGGYGGSSGGNFPPGMRPFNGGSPAEEGGEEVSLTFLGSHES